MYAKTHAKLTWLLLLCICLLAQGFSGEQEPKKALTYKDMMQFKHIQNPTISQDGAFLAYGLQPDRGDGEARIHNIKENKVFTVDRGSDPLISNNSRWVSMFVRPKATDREKAEKDRPKQGLAILDTQRGETITYEKVQRFSFSDDSRWLTIHFFKEDKGLEEKESKDAGQEMSKGKAKKKETLGSQMILRNLAAGNDMSFSHVLSSAFDKASKYLVFSVAGPEGKDNGLYFIVLEDKELSKKSIKHQEKGLYTNLAWAKKGSLLAFLEGKDEKGLKGLVLSLWIWDGTSKNVKQAVAPEDIPETWLLPEKNDLSWSEDGNRVFFGFKPEEFHPKKEADSEEEESSEEHGEIDLFDTDEILKKREVDVWHWNDPLIVTNQKIMWPRVKDRTYLAIYHLDSDQVVQLADRKMPLVQRSANPDFALGTSNVPYQKEITWYGELQDVYVVSLKDGSRKKVVERIDGGFSRSWYESSLSLSPSGRYVVYYKDKHWFLYDGQTSSSQNLTKNLDVPFYDEDHDYPRPAPGYRTPGWVEDDKAVLIYDKYDIWIFDTESGKAVNVTQGSGRETQRTFRVIRVDREQRFFKKSEHLLLAAYHNLEKHHGFYACRLDRPGVAKLLEDSNKFSFKAKAKKADKILYTRESYTEYPDLWVSDAEFKSPKRITVANPQIEDFAWGTAELVEWGSIDGIPLQGVLIKPGNYETGKRYPVVVYFYRFFSQRLHEFNQVVVNHRPCFPLYASNGYAVFLPDVRFDIGRPGYSATKCLVPGIQKLVDMGVADPDAIGLHGHSWSGYQTAFVITQTDIFACAVAGAPVSNMTSAYSGIRWGSGLARQMQYEQQQSRIGGSLWEYPERYIENSPVFFADRINTPLLIQFGDEDGAVPWYQGIELYLAMRRLAKDCVFLQYRKEPHHLQKYPNKLDYTIKMMEYFDHYLKGKPAPDWITKGVPYRGK
ncbi:MAG: prolyl oligopeptidase family serine peptidase [Candidatus Aminicenantes bacterium]|jgi:dipeptidyl aminopeptidase/acylaminoacyl peptidase